MIADILEKKDAGTLTQNIQGMKGLLSFDASQDFKVKVGSGDETGADRVDGAVADLENISKLTADLHRRLQDIDSLVGNIENPQPKKI